MCVRCLPDQSPCSAVSDMLVRCLPDQSPNSAISDMRVRCLLRLICPET